MVVRGKNAPVVAPSQLDQLLYAVEAEEGRRSLKAFIQASWHIVEPGTPFVDGMPIDAMVLHLEALARGEIKRLVVNIPPRHMKSTMISVIWPVWCWIHNPEERFLCASYSLSLSIRDNRRKRLLIESEWFQLRYGHVLQISGDQNLKSRFENDHRGYQLATSVGSATTGEGGSILIIDDAHNAMEAHSVVERENALTWFRETWSSRLNNQQNGRMIVVGQRIHDEDVCGYILKERPDWIHLNLPAYFEPDRKCITPVWSDPRSEEGELLWPERFGVEVLNGLKRDLGSQGFAAQYQQLPVPAGGGQFKKQWFRSYSVLYRVDVPGSGETVPNAYVLARPEGEKSVLVEQCHRIITVDLAISQKQSADYTVIGVWAITPERELLLIDCLREHLDNPEQQKQIQLLYQRYHPDYILVENVAYQLAIIQQLLRLGLPAREYKPVKDKVSRASTAAVLYEAGRIYHPRVASWLVDFEEELLLFPMAAHDDQVDITSMAADAVSGPIASATDHIEALKKRAQLAQQRIVRA